MRDLESEETTETLFDAVASADHVLGEAVMELEDEEVAVSMCERDIVPVCVVVREASFEVEGEIE